MAVPPRGVERVSRDVLGNCGSRRDWGPRRHADTMADVGTLRSSEWPHAAFCSPDGLHHWQHPLGRDGRGIYRRY